MFEVGMPIQMLSKLIAGHASVLMTIYYGKITKEKAKKEIRNAIRKLERSSASDLQSYLRDSSDELFKAEASVTSDVILDMAKRNQGHPDLFVNQSICATAGSGCNEGFIDPSSIDQKPSAVPASPDRKCVMCRFYIPTTASYMELATKFNLASYKLEESRELLSQTQERLNELEDNQALCIIKEKEFEHVDDLFSLRREVEDLSSRVNMTALELHYICSSISRLDELIDKKNNSKKSGLKLIPVGSTDDLTVKLVQASSEFPLLQQICESAEIYPNMVSPSATFKRSQYLDKILARNGKPPFLYSLSETQQVEAGNSFMDIMRIHAGSTEQAMTLITQEENYENDETMDKLLAKFKQTLSLGNR